MDGEERVKAAVDHIVKTLGTNNVGMTKDIIEIFSNFDERFNGLKKDNEQLPDGLSSALSLAEEVICKWDNQGTSGKRVWDCEQDAASYLHAVDEVQNILDSLSLAESRAGVDRAKTLLNKSMARLEEEFRHLLASNSGVVDPELLNRSFSSLSMAVNSFDSVPEDTDGSSRRSLGGGSSRRSLGGGSSRRSLGGDPPYREDAETTDDEDDEDVPVAHPVTDLNPLVDLLSDELVKDLRDIAKRMIQAERQSQCCQVYSSIRKMVMDETLRLLGMEKLSFDEVQKMQWEDLDAKIKNWLVVINAGVKVLVASERKLCDQVFEDFPAVEEACFAELAKGTMMQLLNFGEAVACGKRSPDKLISILDMYVKLRNVLPEINSIFSGEACLTLREEASGVLIRLGQAARGTFAEFENAIYRDPPKASVPGGALHPLTRFVMNYLRLLLVYLDTLNQLFGERTEAPVVPGETNGHHGYVDASSSSSGMTEEQEMASPVAKQFIVIIQLLQSNLENKAKLYKDLALTNLFLMNNVHYIVQKVRSSEELRSLLGDDWIKKKTAQVRQHATSYQRSAWVKVLSFLKDEGIRASGSFSSGVSKAVLKDRFKSFNAAFEEIHKTQSTWSVPDPQLRTELRISISVKLLPAYSPFLGRYSIYLDSERHPEKYIKYTPEELEVLIGDLFGGAK